MSEFDKSGNYTNGWYITLPEAKDRQAQFLEEMKKQPNLRIKHSLELARRGVLKQTQPRTHTFLCAGFDQFCN